MRGEDHHGNRFPFSGPRNPNLLSGPCPYTLVFCHMASYSKIIDTQFLNFKQNEDRPWDSESVPPQEQRSRTPA